MSEQQVEKTNRLKKLGDDEQQQSQIDEIEKDHIAGFTEKQQKFVNLNQQKADLEAKAKKEKEEERLKNEAEKAELKKAHQIDMERMRKKAEEAGSLASHIMTKTAMIIATLALMTKTSPSMNPIILL